MSRIGHLIAAADWNASTTIWNVASGSIVKSITDHNGDVTFAELSPDGKTLATESEDKTLGLCSVDEFVGD